MDEDDNKVRCGICKKLFKGKQFYENHIKTRHDEVYEKVVKNRINELILQNYLSDPYKLHNQIEFAQNPGHKEGNQFGHGNQSGDRNKRYYQDLDDPENNKNIKVNRILIDYNDI